MYSIVNSTIATLTTTTSGLSSTTKVAKVLASTIASTSPPLQTTTIANGLDFTFPTIPTYSTLASYPTPATIIITPVDGYYWYGYYYYYLLILLLLCIGLIALKVAMNRRRELARLEALTRARQRAQAHGENIDTIVESCRTDDARQTVVPKNTDQPPAYDDVMQAYINTKQELQAAEEGAVGGNLPTTRSTITMQTELNNSSASLFNANPTVVTTITTTTLTNEIASPPEYDKTIGNHNNEVA